MDWLLANHIWITFPLGFVLLIYGADRLVGGASGLARQIGMSPLVVGLTVVAFGTSAPELAVSVAAVIRGEGDLALGNVVGSNITNILLILGLSAIVAPLIVKRQLMWFDLPIMVGICVLAWILALDGNVSRIDGIALVGLLGVYIFLLLNQTRKERNRRDALQAEEEELPSVLSGVLWFVLGIGLVLLGTHWLVGGAITIATALDVSELVIGLTIVSLGSSLPELATSIVASLKGERDIAVGNVIGSNTFNVLCVLGITSIVAPAGVPVPDGSIWVDFPVMLAVVLVCLPIFYTGLRVSKLEGAVLLTYYVLWTLYLVLDARHHPFTGRYALGVVTFVVPLTAIAILGTVIAAVRKRQTKKRRVKARRQRRLEAREADNARQASQSAPSIEAAS